MNKLKYILKCIRTLDYKNMIKIAKKIAKKEHKLTDKTKKFKKK